MQKRKLGNSNLEVSAIGLGCMGMSFSYGPPKNKQDMTALLQYEAARGGRNEILQKTCVLSHYQWFFWLLEG
ncbi:aldo/keto reductase [Tolypothrix tenuis PCC 7101]|uniref:Aldo/keto reductase n=1 Tax=Tolypothrix tenuis PCC 7101 TaxID=231146 RepID=A0A1Z4N0G3_9CYAN|nr:aldo/keto reductase [Tolypothrix tenuis PCC 7101]BAZ76873.1 aldo/keto reductase [Aulosira laxa NIES-50]